MAAEDELALPRIPEERAEDPEDVSWALSTAEAMWARGDHLEGIKWVRKAAEAASDVEDDERALELAKAASELTTMLARRSQASVHEGPGLAGGAPPDAFVPQQGPPWTGPPTSARPPSAQPPNAHPPSMPPPSAQPPSVPPSTSRMGNAPSLPMPPTMPVAVPTTTVDAAASRPPSAQPPPPPPPGSSASSLPPAARSGPPGPIPLPSRASAAPRPPQAPQAPRGAPRPLATAATAPAAPRAPKGRRRSRENLDAEAQAAAILDTAPQPAVDGDAADRALAKTVADEPSRPAVVIERPVQHARTKRRSRPDLQEATVIATLDELREQERQRQKAAEVWDTSPTQNLSGEDMDHMNVGDRMTAMAVPAPVLHVPSSPPAARAQTSALHDPAIQTSQAVRVVVWRDGNGVHVAPAGTVVSSITIDAVLVVLEPTADLTAWLSQRER